MPRRKSPHHDPSLCGSDGKERTQQDQDYRIESFAPGEKQECTDDFCNVDGHVDPSDEVHFFPGLEDALANR